MLNLNTKVLNLLKERGPSLPVHVAKSVERDIIFAGAVLSELVSRKEVKITTAKVGGSPLYYISGQEEKLDILYNYLPLKEKEAYNLLKEKKFIYDRQADPSIRVAFRMLKDFAKPIEVNTPKGKELAWYWHLEDPQQFMKKKVEVKPQKIESQQQLQKPPKPIAKTDDNFTKTIEQYFMQKNIKILEKNIIRKNTESNYIISIDTQIGKIDLFVCTKNKKKISDNDLTIAHQKGQEKKMLTMFITSGELTKKAKEYLEKKLKGLVLFRSVQP